MRKINCIVRRIALGQMGEYITVGEIQVKFRSQNNIDRNNIRKYVQNFCYANSFMYEKFSFLSVLFSRVTFVPID